KEGLLCVRAMKYAHTRTPLSMPHARTTFQKKQNVSHHSDSKEKTTQKSVLKCFTPLLRQIFPQQGRLPPPSLRLVHSVPRPRLPCCRRPRATLPSCRA